MRLFCSSSFRPFDVGAMLSDFGIDVALASVEGECVNVYSSDSFDVWLTIGGDTCVYGRRESFWEGRCRSEGWSVFVFCDAGRRRWVFSFLNAGRVADEVYISSPFVSPVEYGIVRDLLGALFSGEGLLFSDDSRSFFSDFRELETLFCAGGSSVSFFGDCVSRLLALDCLAYFGFLGCDRRDFWEYFLADGAFDSVFVPFFDVSVRSSDYGLSDAALRFEALGFGSLFDVGTLRGGVVSDVFFRRFVDVILKRRWTFCSFVFAPRSLHFGLFAFVFQRGLSGRKNLGAYYSPAALSDYLCAEAVYRRVNRILEDNGHVFDVGADVFLPEDTLLTMDVRCASLLVDVLGRFSLLDPACGGGAFLISFFRYVMNVRCFCFSMLDGVGGDVFFDSGVSALRVVEDNVYGVDIVEDAVNVAKMLLYLNAVVCFSENVRVPSINEVRFNLECGNSLLGLLPPFDDVSSEAYSESATKKRGRLSEKFLF